MARHAVNLTRKTTRKPNGRSYTYWVLRWFRTDGTQAGKAIGRVDRMSRRLSSIQTANAALRSSKARMSWKACWMRR